MSDDKIKAKIQALLAKANDTSVTVEEAQAFNAKAYELMEKYNLDRATVEGHDNSKRTHLTLVTTLRPWNTSILAGLTHLYFCKWYYTPYGRKHTITIIGEESNAAVCHAIAIMVLRAVEGEAKRTGGGRSFMTGAGYTIHSRCLEMRPQAAPAGTISTNATSGTTPNALVSLEQKEKTGNDLYMENELGIKNLRRTTSKPRVNSHSSLAAGVEYGKSVQLSNRMLR